jgi:hypothetical protein
MVVLFVLLLQIVVCDHVIIYIYLFVFLTVETNGCVEQGKKAKPVLRIALVHEKLQEHMHAYICKWNITKLTQESRQLLLPALLCISLCLSLTHGALIKPSRP